MVSGSSPEFDTNSICRLGSFLSLTAVIGISAFAQNPLLKKNTRATLDEPVKDFKLRDLMKDLKENQKEEEAMVSISQFKDKKEPSKMVVQTL